MARSHCNAITGSARGKIGDLVVKCYAYGQVLTRLPRKSIVPPSEKQRFNQQRWSDAAAYYRKVKADPLLFMAYSRALPKLKTKGYPLNALTNRDFFNPPRVTEIDLHGYSGRADERIKIHAYDDFSVTAVDVTVRDAAGHVIEQGPAWEDIQWHYCTKVIAPPGPVTFEVVAQDLPGNRATLTKVWQPAGGLRRAVAVPVTLPSAPAALDFDPRAG
jgi:hypothetical protein